MLPFLVEVDAISADDGEARLVGDVEARGADDGVDFAMLAVVADDSGFVYLVDGGEVDVDVVFLDGFHVGITGRNAAALDW